MKAAEMMRKFLILMSINFICVLSGCCSSVNKNYILSKDKGKGLIIITTTETGIALAGQTGIKDADHC